MKHQNNGLVVKNLRKTYREGQLVALEDISLEVEPGELFGILGPDGAGKTTLFRLLTTLLLPDKGEAWVAGEHILDDLWTIRKIVGYMPGRFSLYQDLSVIENLNFFATVFHTTVEENYHLIADIYDQLAPFKDRPAGKLSGGMKQKLALCCALVHEPQILFLDEPTTGVDPVSRREFWDMLDRLKAKGITIIVSTPYMDEAGRCDRIALLQEGRLLDVDTLEGMIDKHRRPLWAVRGEDMYQLLQDLRDYPATESCLAFGDTHHLSLVDESMGTEEVARFLTDRGHLGFSLEAITPSIEDTFIRLMQKEDQS